ncbi:MAG: HAMP domain-containing histidine kinase, partial [Candidatus Sericytochromatia bacterium]|nr:HAMP domain-containing histidine kinase [Candidatus Tanganyikabacteria bacterium]
LSDVTERKRAQAQAFEAAISAQAAQAEAASARELDRLKSHLISVVSHELRTPITTIRGFGEFLLDELEARPEPELADYARQIVTSSERLQLLVDDLLDAVSIEAGTFSVNPEEADAAVRIQEIIDSLSLQFRDAKLAVAVEVPKAGMAVHMDSRRIGQVLLNLLSNAIKFTPDGGRISVRASATDGALRCEVTDSGIGIADNDVPKLFRRFSQIEPGPRRHVGTGLGLSICKAIVEAHGGEIGVSSEKGRGSTFWFTLPAYVD